MQQPAVRLPPAELGYLGLPELLAAYDAGDLDPSAVVRALLDRAAALDPPGSTIGLRSICAMNPAAAQQAASGAGGLLRGIPVLVKDNIEVAGLPTTAGSSALAGRPARVDAPAVARLRAAGAVVLGATNMSEWANIRSAASTSGWSAVGGLTGNPWALDRSAGGSSSGSAAAVAAGLAPVALGTETDGSVICPASLAGVVGLKPAVGAVPTAGVVPLSTSQDSVGVLARTVVDAAHVFEVLAARPGVRDRVSQGIGGLRVAVAATWRTGHAATDALFSATLDRLTAAGAHLHEVEVAIPGPELLADELTVLLCELVDGLARYLPGRGPAGPQHLADVVAHNRTHADVELAHFGQDLFERALRLGGSVAPEYRPARLRCLEWARGRCLTPALTSADVLVAPTFGPAWKRDLVLGDRDVAASPLTCAPAISGWPVATAPMGLVEGLPTGFGVTARPGAEDLLLAVCAAVEQPMRPAWRPPARG